MNLKDVVTLAHQILEPRLKRFGFSGVDVREEEGDSDSETETILIVRAKYGEDATEPEPRASLEAEVALKQALYRAGETREAYLLHELPSDAESLPSEP
jgi:hypothetical protein